MIWPFRKKPKTTEFDVENLALNESFFYAVTIDERQHRVLCRLQMATYFSESEVYPEYHVAMELTDVSQIYFRHKEGKELLPVADLRELETIVREIGGCAIYGWEFLNSPWKRKKCSIQVRFGSTHKHSLYLFQDPAGHQRSTELYILFDSIRFVALDGKHDSDQVIVAGKKWWDEFYKGNPKTMDWINRPKLDENGNLISIGAVAGAPLKS